MHRIYTFGTRVGVIRVTKVELQAGTVLGQAQLKLELCRIETVLLNSHLSHFAWWIRFNFLKFGLVNLFQ